MDQESAALKEAPATTAMAPHHPSVPSPVSSPPKQVDHNSGSELSDIDDFGFEEDEDLEQKKPEEEEEDEEEEGEEDYGEWYFRCEGCGLQGKNLDDHQQHIFCEQCSTWHHSKCVGVTKKQAKDPNFDWLCTACTEKNKAAMHPPDPHGFQFPDKGKGKAMAKVEDDDMEDVIHVREPVKATPQKLTPSSPGDDLSDDDGDSSSEFGGKDEDADEDEEVIDYEMLNRISKPVQQPLQTPAPKSRGRKVNTENINSAVKAVASASLTQKEKEERAAYLKAKRREARLKAKKVTADLDTDDELIMNMHMHGRKDVEIAEFMKNERNLVYEPKSVVSRINRIIRAQMAQHDLDLEEELTDWHADDDDMLKQANQLADADMKAEIEKIKKLRWEMVSRHLMALKPTSRFSSKACEARFVGLMDGTAICPPEHDPDPVGRQERKIQRRLAKMAEEEAKKALIEQSKENTRRAKEEKRRKREERQKYEAEKPERMAARIQKSVEKAAAEQAKRERMARERKAAIEAQADENKDPRYQLSMEDLHDICRKRKLPTEGSKHEIMLRLVAQDYDTPIRQIRKILQAQYVTVFGNKMKLLERMAVHEAIPYLDAQEGGVSLTAMPDDDDMDGTPSGTTPTSKPLAVRPKPNKGKARVDDDDESDMDDDESDEDDRDDFDIPEEPRQSLKRKTKEKPKVYAVDQGEDDMDIDDDDSASSPVEETLAKKRKKAAPKSTGKKSALSKEIIDTDSD